MGVITSLGETVDALWDNVLMGRCGIDAVKRFDASQFDVRFGGECNAFDPQKYMDRKLEKRMDRFAQMAFAAAKNAAADGGVQADSFVPERFAPSSARASAGCSKSSSSSSA